MLISGCLELVSYNCANSTERLVISPCHSIRSLKFPIGHDNLLSTLKHLDIRSSHTLDGSWLLNNYLSSLTSLFIVSFSNVRSFPEGCLLHLSLLCIVSCENIESIPENGFGFLPLLCLRRFHIDECKNLKSFPHEHLQSLSSLEALDVRNCPSMDSSFPCGLWPPNLSFLRIGGLKKPMSEWGLQNFPTSLVWLRLDGQNSGVVSLSLLVPPSLTTLYIDGFMELESVSKDLQHLSCLNLLSIKSCPKLKDLPAETILVLLSSLFVENCPKLVKRCDSKKGKYWPVISQIPYLHLG